MSLIISPSGGVEVDTLATVTGRGASTSTSITLTGTAALRGSYGPGSFTSNFAAGNAALNVNSTGTFNTAVGVNALAGNTAGMNNVAVGNNASLSNTNGSQNVSIGNRAAQLNTTGSNNTAVGEGALYFNVTGQQNTAYGNAALFSATGSYNLGLGRMAGSSLTSGDNNVIIGGYDGAASPINGSANSYIVLSTGNGVIRQTFNGNGALAFDTAGVVVGATGQVLTSNGTASPPTWSNSITLSTVAAVAAADITITGATSSTTAGTAYAVTITGGQGADGTAAGKGGAVNITGGRSGNNASAGAAVYGGLVNITGGAGNTLLATSAPGGVVIAGGAAQIAGQAGANITISASAGFSSTTSATGGNLLLNAGAGGGTAGTNGYVSISAPGNAGGPAAYVALSVAGSERFRALATGAISFGTTGTAYGTSGQVLTSAGNAAPTWSSSISLSGDISGGIVYALTSSAAGRGFCVKAPSGDATPAIIQFTNNAISAQWASLSATSTTLTCNVSAGFVSSSNITAYSDERLKTDWVKLPINFVEQLAKVKSGTYTRIDSNTRQAGSSAQDWQLLLPEVVLEAEDTTLSLAYGNAALVSAIELAKRVVELEAKLNKLENLVSKLIEV